MRVMHLIRAGRACYENERVLFRVVLKKLKMEESRMSKPEEK